jgi:hypothetical protein
MPSTLYTEIPGTEERMTIRRETLSHCGTRNLRKYKAARNTFTASHPRNQFESHDNPNYVENKHNKINLVLYVGYILYIFRIILNISSSSLSSLHVYPKVTGNTS